MADGVDDEEAEEMIPLRARGAAKQSPDAAAEEVAGGQAQSPAESDTHIPLAPTSAHAARRAADPAHDRDTGATRGVAADSDAHIPLAPARGAAARERAEEVVTPSVASGPERDIPLAPARGQAATGTQSDQEPTPLDRALDASTDADESRRRYSLEDWKRLLISLLIGAGLAGLGYALPLGRQIAEVFSVIVHELGHAAASWAFGYPAIPALDLSHGGGLTPTWNRVPAIAIGIPLVLFGAGLAVAQNRFTKACVVIVAAVFGALALTDWHQAVIIGMGHGLVLIFSALFLFRGLTGMQTKLGAERPLYVGLGLLFAIFEIENAWRLLDNLVYRQHYLESKAGVVRDDLTRLADDHLHTTFDTVTTALLAGGVVALIVGFALAALATHDAARHG